ncbi:hypothetical protein ATO2_06330 [Roseovarius sp. 22II1-1F6A]|nr:hypothetical protein ATO2_06330 [Roseovarius sp. 22II1-1F6A]
MRGRGMQSKRRDRIAAWCRRRGEAMRLVPASLSQNAGPVIRGRVIADWAPRATTRNGMLITKPDMMCAL